MLQALAEGLSIRWHGLTGISEAQGTSHSPVGRSPSGLDFLLRRCNFCLPPACIYSCRFHHWVGNFSASPLKYMGATLSTANGRALTHSHKGESGCPHLCLLHWNPCLTLITPQLLWCMFLQMWLLLPSLLPPARGTLCLTCRDS